MESKDSKKIELIKFRQFELAKIMKIFRFNFSDTSVVYF